MDLSFSPSQQLLQQSARSLQHLAQLFRLADKARVLADPELAVERMRRVLAVHGVS